MSGSGLWYWVVQYLIYEWWMVVGLLIPSGDSQKRSSRVVHCAFRRVAAGIYSRRAGQKLGKGVGTVNREDFKRALAGRGAERELARAGRWSGVADGSRWD